MRRRAGRAFADGPGRRAAAASASSASASSVSPSSVRVVDERRAVERDQAVAAGREAECSSHGCAAARARRGARAASRSSCSRPGGRRRRRCPRAARLSTAELRVGEQDRAQVVGELAVVLLGHRRVEAPQARLDVGDRDDELGRRECGRERRVDVTGDDDEVGALLLEDARRRRTGRARSARRGCPSRRRGRRPGSGRPSSREEHVGHLGVVVLPGVDEEQLGASGRALAARASTGAAFMKFGPRPDHEANLRTHPASMLVPIAGLAALPSRVVSRLRLREPTIRGGRGIEVLFWVSLAALAWTHVRYPIAVALARAAAAARREARDEDADRRRDRRRATTRRRVIERRVANLLALDYPREQLEIVVTSDASTDRTEELASAAGARVIRNPRGGKVAAQDSAVRETESEIVAFSDANATWAPGRAPRARRAVRRPATSPTSAGSCGWRRPTAANKEGLYWRYEMARSRGRVARSARSPGGNGSDLRGSPLGLRRGRPALRARSLAAVPDGPARQAGRLRAGGAWRSRSRRRRTRPSTAARCACSSTAG